MGRTRSHTKLALETDATAARLVQAADKARRRLERDLHDGAQQQFILATLAMRRALAQARGTAVERFVAEGLEHLQQGLHELRELARGIHPAVLTERGIAAALDALAGRSPLPVELHVTGERFAPPAEAAIYFAVTEALTNIAKHASAALVRIDVDTDTEDGTLFARVADDGVGGASAASGSGLRGLADRLAALGGTLTVDSPIGGGTIVQATVPTVPGSRRSPNGPPTSTNAAGACRDAAVSVRPPV
jgi:signal transduction histidine kinase